MRRMREILFRGKRIIPGLKEGKWVYGYYQYHQGFSSIITFDGNVEVVYEVSPKTVGEYVGKKDITGKRIFEDDIIEACCPSMGGTFNARLVVCYHKGVPVFHQESTETYKDKWKFFRQFESESLHDIKVVGNRFDNRGLLRELGLDRM
jgi:uncharacterized phage protein (TIGR01671 family)